MTDLYTLAKNVLLYGESPDGDPWHGGGLNMGLSFVSPSVKLLRETKNADGSVSFTAEFRFGALRFSDGYSCDSFLIQRFMNAYPQGEAPLVKAFIDIMEEREPELERQITKWFKEQTEKPFSDIVGYHEAEEWGRPTLAKLGSVEFTDPPGGIYQGKKLKLMFIVKAVIRAQQKPDAGAAPFDSMTDKEVDYWVKQWASEAPENFWMDGELRMSYRDAVKMYRNRWRSWKPHQQLQMLRSLGWKRTAAQKVGGTMSYSSKRVAQRYLQACLVYSPESITRTASGKIGKSGDTVVYANDDSCVEFAKLRLKMLRARERGGTFDPPGLKRLPGGRPGFAGSGTSFWMYKDEKYLEERFANGKGFHGTDMIISKVVAGDTLTAAQQLANSRITRFLGYRTHSKEARKHMAKGLGIRFERGQTVTITSVKDPSTAKSFLGDWEVISWNQGVYYVKKPGQPEATLYPPGELDTGEKRWFIISDEETAAGWEQTAVTIRAVIIG